MADSILSSILSKASLTLSSSADDQNKDVIPGLQVVSVQFKYRSRPMRHMREDGVSIVDAKVLDPAIVDVDVICPTLDDINHVNIALMNREATYTLTSKGIQLTDVVATDFNVRQSPDMLSASQVKLTFRQLQRQGGFAAHKVVEQPPDASIFGRGIQQAKKVTASMNETFAKVFNG